MNNVLSLYFDGAIVQAVKVRITGNSVMVDDARTLPFDDFDEYFSTCSAKSCIVCCNPQQFYQDIVHLPPAAAKLYDKLIRNEIQRIHPDLSTFSFFYRIIGESMIDAKPYSKIAVFSYPDEFLSGFISELNRFGISVSHAYAAPYCILSTALSTCTTDFDQPRIFIASLLGEKLLLVCENNELEFIRKIPSLDSALLPEDANHINMTVDYCFQSLRVRPFEAVMLNQPELSEELSHLVSVPYRSTLPSQLKELPPHIIQDYFAPVAAALHFVTSPRIGNISPSGYADFTMHKKLLASAATFMFVLALLISGYLVKELMVISDLRSTISKKRSELSLGAAELAKFRKLDDEVNQLKQPLEFVNKYSATVSPAAALAALTLPEISEAVIKGVTVQSSGSVIDVKLEGVVNASIYSDAQARFEELVARLAKLPGYSVSSSTIDIKHKTFVIMARYNSGGQPVK